jgi:thioredoxin reductase
MYDVIIVGGGPAGLSAALTLGRCRRSVLVIDHGKPRNAPAEAMHGYLTRDGINPLQLLQFGRQEIEAYDVEFIHAEVVDAARRRNGFEVKLHNRQRHRCKKILLATGMRDQLPRIEGLTDFYGISIHHCPYCDGWEWRDKALAVYGNGKHGIGLALALMNWSSDIALLGDGQNATFDRYRKIIAKNRMRIYPHKIMRLEGKRGCLRQIVFADGSTLKRDAMFFNTGQRQKSTLAAKLGCSFDRNGGVMVDRRERTCVPGVFVAGDASKDVQFVIKAAAEGAVAAVAINKELQHEEGRVL